MSEGNTTTWLVAENEPDLHGVLLSVCELWSIDGLAFSNGQNVFNWVERVDHSEFADYLPKLALLDVRLPNISGLEVSARIRQSEYLKDIAIVVMTAYRLSPEDEVNALEQPGADLLIYNPFPAVDELHKILSHLIK